MRKNFRQTKETAPGQSSHRPFAGYTRQGKRLVTSWNRVMGEMQKEGRVGISSWRDDALPEYLWAAIVRFQLGADQSTSTFVQIGEQWPSVSTNAKLVGPYGSHSQIASMPSKLRRATLNAIVRALPSPDVLSPLRLIDGLPAARSWQSVLPEPANDGAWEVIGNAIMACSEHKSDDATDICWLINMIAVNSGMMMEPADPEFVRRRQDYPKNREVLGGFYRADELSQRQMLRTKWPAKFWTSMYRVFDPQAAHPDLRHFTDVSFEYEHTLLSLLDGLRFRFWKTRTQAFDVPHSILFGFPLFAVQLACSLARGQGHASFAGIVALRSITEATINMAYLIKEEKPELFDTFYRYGYERASLMVEKHQHMQARGSSLVDGDWVSMFSAEHIGRMFIDINLGDWCQSDLRSRAEQSKTKDLYDTYYDYASSLLHADWLGVASYAYTWDINPFHRLQRVPRQFPRRFPSVIPHLLRLIHRQLELLGKVYHDMEFTMPEGRSEWHEEDAHRRREGKE